MRARFAATLFATTCLAFGAIACSVIAGIETFESPTNAAIDEAGVVDAPVVDARAPILPLDACACDASAASVCYAGDCYPKEVAIGLVSPAQIAVVGNWVVWNEPGGDEGSGLVRGCATDGPPCADKPVTVSNLPQYKPRLGLPGARTDGVLIAYENERPNTGIGTASSISQISAPKTMMEIASVAAGEGSIVAAAASSAWIVYATPESITLRDRQKSTASSMPFDTNQKPSQMAVSGTKWFGLSADDLRIRTFDLVTRDTPSVYALPSPYTSVVDFIVDSAELHVVVMQNESTAALVTQPIDPAREPGIPVPLPGSGRVTADDTRIYVTVPAAKKIFAVSKSTRALTLLYQVDATALAVDAEFLYWISGSTVFKAPKG